MQRGGHGGFQTIKVCRSKLSRKSVENTLEGGGGTSVEFSLHLAPSTVRSSSCSSSESVLEASREDGGAHI